MLFGNFFYFFQILLIFVKNRRLYPRGKQHLLPQKGWHYMTDEEKTRVIDLMQRGNGYNFIAKQLGLNYNTVKSFCNRYKERTECTEIYVEVKYSNFYSVHCKCCGEVFPQDKHRKPQYFCCDKCRMKWWNDHRNELRFRNPQKHICDNCGEIFVNNRPHTKFCSKECYIAFQRRRDSDV